MDTRTEFLQMAESMWNDLKKLQLLLDKAHTDHQQFASQVHYLAHLCHSEELVDLCGLKEVEEGLDHLDELKSCDKEIVIGDSSFEEITELPLLSVGYRLEEYDTFWIDVLNSTVEAQHRVLLRKLMFTSSSDLFLDLVGELQLKFIFSSVVMIERKTLTRMYNGFSSPGSGWSLVRNYDGFNGPGSLHGAFDFVLALVRDYDGFNGPGHTLWARCL